MAKIGVAVVEDDGIYLTVAEVEKAGILKIPSPLPIARPDCGYSGTFIKEQLKSYFEDRETDLVAVSMFGQIDSGEGKLLDVPRPDWVAEERSLDFADWLPRTRVYHDSSTAALGEWLFRNDARKNFDHPEGVFARIRIGAGVGVGFVERTGDIRTTQLRQSNPEAGHLPVFRGLAEAGTCRSHSNKGEWDCIEGLLSEERIRRRCGGAPLDQIPPDNPVWDSVSRYLAVLCVAINTLALAGIIVIGGRTMIGADGKAREWLLKKIRDAFVELIGSYPSLDDWMHTAETYIAPSCAVPNPAWVSLLGVTELGRREIWPLNKE